jgi:hypothetical protein
MQQAIQDYFNQICCTTPTVTYNFDVDSSDWAGVGITDQASFESELGVTTSDFLLSGNNIKANILTTTGNTLNMSTFNITNINYITVAGLQLLELSSNQIANLNLTSPLPSSISTLNLGDNQMTTTVYTNLESWANGMHTAPSGGQIILNNNTNSASGTNLEAILIGKGWTVTI